MAPMTVIKLNLHSVAGVDAFVAASRFSQFFYQALRKYAKTKRALTKSDGRRVAEKMWKVADINIKLVLKHKYGNDVNKISI